MLGFIPTEGDRVTAPPTGSLSGPPTCSAGRSRTTSTKSSSRWTTAARLPGARIPRVPPAGIEVLELPSFLERETGKVRLDVLNPSWIIFGEGFRARRCSGCWNAA